jgi:nitroreductase
LELDAAVRTQRMVRSFAAEPVASDVVDRLLAVAASGPSAGFSQGLDLVVLQGPVETARYWDASLPAAERTTFPWPQLLDADVLVVLVTRPSAYVARYAEGDKAATGLGRGPESWPVPYWFVDAGMAAELLLLAAVDEGLGALFFGVFARAAEIRDALALPADVEPVGVVAVGHPAPDRPSRSAGRGRRPLDDVVHRGRW